MSTQQPTAVKPELDRLMSEFLRSVSFEPGLVPRYQDIHHLFMDGGLLIKNISAAPEVATVAGFIEPRQANVSAGELTRFLEQELSETTVVFGNVAHRFSAYAKSGTLKGQPFAARGMISTQFVLTPHGWKMSCMAWDDERPGLSLPDGAASLPRKGGP
jgi:hypothetical protein